MLYAQSIVSLCIFPTSHLTVAWSLTLLLFDLTTYPKNNALRLFTQSWWL